VPRILTRSEMLAATDISGNVFDRMISRGGMALTFGARQATVPNRYLSTDPIHARVVVELSKQFRPPEGLSRAADLGDPTGGQPMVAAIVRLNNLVVLKGIVDAEAHPEWQLGLALIHDKTDHVQLVCRTDEGLIEFLSGGLTITNERQRPLLGIKQIVVIDFTKLIADVRRQAKKKKVDLGEPLFMAADDQRFRKICDELAEVRDRDTKVLEKLVAYEKLRTRYTERITMQ
jgi:hypothetical protein